MAPKAVFPDISTRSDLRAYHASDIYIVFGTYNSTTAPVAATPTEIALSAYIQSAWVAFARNPATGLTGADFTWPEYGATKEVILLGNSANPKGKTIVSSGKVDTDCEDIDALVTVYNALGLNISLL